MSPEELMEIAEEIAAKSEAIPRRQDGAHRTERRKIINAEIKARVIPSFQWQVLAYVRKFVAAHRTKAHTLHWNQSHSSLFKR